VPTLSVNLVDLTARLRTPVSADAVNTAYREAARSPRWQGLLALAPDHAVSTDFTGRPESVLMDLDLTRVLGDRLVKVFGWHDNETAYAARLTELVRSLTNPRSATPARR
jgi:glyceraldehyde 3-phosphate dehydrogenase